MQSQISGRPPPQTMNPSHVMETLSLDISPKQLVSAGVQNLPERISAALPQAQKVLAKGEWIRKKHSEGNLNCSLTSTAEGTIQASNQVVDHLAEPQPVTKHAFFGENIRRTIRALKLLRG